MMILIDMNLSPLWVAYLRSQNIESVHWSAVGSPNAPDSEIMAWARERKQIVFTHDLDFSTILALTGNTGPSVIQIKGQDVMPSSMGETVVKVLKKFESDFNQGILATIDKDRSRIRFLPIHR